MKVSTADRRFHAAGVAFLISALAGWLVLSIVAVTRQGTWADEANYILKSWWYVNGTVKPYSAEDSTWYQPLIFYAVGAWQLIAGHGIVASRLLTMLITAGNLALLAWLLRRLGCGVWPISAAIVIFALTEDSIFYFSSVTPFALAILLQLIALHLLLSMNGSASVKLALMLGAVLTAAYLLRINLVIFIALALAVAWVRAGRDRWRVTLCSAAIMAITWSLLALTWGSRFIYISTWLPGVTDWLVHAGLLPDFYPNMPAFSSHTLVVEHEPGFAAFLGYVFGWEMLRDWILAHHVIPIAAALFAIVVASVCRIPNRGWTLLFALSFWVMMLYHHLGGQSFCPICIQAYANYFDFFAALAGGLALQGLLQRSASRVAKAAVVCLIAAAVVVAAVQSWSLTGVNRLPSIRNRTDLTAGGDRPCRHDHENPAAARRGGRYRRQRCEDTADVGGGGRSCSADLSQHRIVLSKAERRSDTRASSEDGCGDRRSFVVDGRHSAAVDRERLRLAGGAAAAGRPQPIVADLGAGCAADNHGPRKMLRARCGSVFRKFRSAALGRILQARAPRQGLPR